MTCTEIEEKLDAYLDGELIEADRASVDAHLGACASCRRVLETLRAQSRELDAAFGPMRDDNQKLIERVIAAVHREEAPALPQARRPWIPMLFAAAAGFLLALVIFRPHRPPDKKPDQASIAPEPVKKPMARLAVATGAIEIRKPSAAEWQPLVSGGEIEKGTCIRTLGRAKCSFDYNDGTEVRLNGNTEILIETIRRIQLRRGQIYTKITPNPVAFNVSTEQAQIEALGTTLDIAHLVREGESHEKEEAGRAITTLTVLEGAAKLGGRIVRTGYTCRVVDGRLDEPNEAYDLVILTKWVNELLALRGGRDEELEKRVNSILAMIGQSKVDYLYEEEIRRLGEHCVLPLTRYLQSSDSLKNPDRRHTAARIVADLAGPRSVPDFVSLLPDRDPVVRVSIARGLERLTGTSQGLNASYWSGRDCGQGCRTWDEWLRENQDTWGPPKSKK